MIYLLNALKFSKIDFENGYSKITIMEAVTLLYVPLTKFGSSKYKDEQEDLTIL